MHMKKNVHKHNGTITLPIEEYKKLKIKEEIADDAIVRLKLSLDDIRHGKVIKVL